MSFFIIHHKIYRIYRVFHNDNEFNGNENATHNTVGSEVKYFVWGVILKFKVGWMGAVEDGIET
jgi:hypothetical protein